VVLFSAVPGSQAIVKLPIGLAGAAAFFFLVLPRVQPFIFPFYSFSGRLAFESVDQTERGYKPVVGADVELMNSGLRATTDAAGKFAVPEVPSQLQVVQILVSRAGRVYPLQVKDYPDKVFRIPRDPEIIKTTEHPIDPSEWVEEAVSTQCRRRKDLFDVKQFSLRKDVQQEGGYADLFIRVLSEGGTEMLNSSKVAPQDGESVQASTDDLREVQWALPVNGKGVWVHLKVCVGATRKNAHLSTSNVRASFWFQKIG
jgi:hypothetical protein